MTVIPPLIPATSITQLSASLPGMTAAIVEVEDPPECQAANEKTRDVFIPLNVLLTLLLEYQPRLLEAQAKRKHLIGLGLCPGHLITLKLRGTWSLQETWTSRLETSWEQILTRNVPAGFAEPCHSSKIFVFKKLRNSHIHFFIVFPRKFQTDQSELEFLFMFKL